MKVKLKVDSFFNSIGLCSLAIVSLGYIIFSRNFAELHIQFGFFDFPVFIGEILLFFCLMLLAIKWLTQLPKFNLWHIGLAFYLIFILVKAIGGYIAWGPLAFRHAALFYYPLFAVCSYYFYQRKFFSDNNNMILSLILILVMRLPFFNEYYVLTCFVLAFILVKANSRKIVRYILFYLLLLFTPYRYFFNTSRTMLVGNLSAVLYFLIIAPFMVKIKKSYKITVFLIVLLFLSIAVMKKAEDQTIKPLLSFKRVMESYNECEKTISERRNDPFWIKVIKNVTKDTTVKLYDSEKDRFKEVLVDQQPAEVEFASSDLEVASSEVEPTPLENKLRSPSEKNKTETQQLQPQAKEVKVEQSPIKAELAEHHQSERLQNVFFRIFIWRDMLSQLKADKPVFGFDFGKPFRSSSIEFLYWGTGEWSRDGWVAAHNSYLEIIYRAGLLGILFILILFITLIKMIRESIRLKSFTGILLCGVFINWLAAANFLVILELPYNAIPFWSLLGVAIAHVYKKDNR